MHLSQFPIMSVCKWQQYIITNMTYAGVSCDNCLRSNFEGKRFKCLICYDYDLCQRCYSLDVTTSRHLASHPVQCILTRNDFGIMLVFYQAILYFSQVYTQFKKWVFHLFEDCAINMFFYRTLNKQFKVSTYSFFSQAFIYKIWLSQNFKCNILAVRP